jgi:multisubunit Na+/H+ antiporter MnhB subunit
MIGAFVMYMMVYRETRVMKFFKNPKTNWPIFFFDIFVYLICGGLVTLFFISPSSDKEAFLSGATWQGLMGGALKGVESGREGEYRK